MSRSELDKALRRIDEAVYREKNRERLREYQRKWKAEARAAEPEKFKDYHAKYHRNRRTDPRAITMMLVNAASKRAIKRGLDFDLDLHTGSLESRISRWRCELSGVTLKAGIGAKQINSVSIDRIDASLGYRYENIRIVAWGLNAAFSDWGEGATIKLMRRYLDRIDLI